MGRRPLGAIAGFRHSPDKRFRARGYAIELCFDCAACLFERFGVRVLRNADRFANDESGAPERQVQ
jgi:hypothetical protein